LLLGGEEGDFWERLEKAVLVRNEYRFELLLMKIQKSLFYVPSCREVVEVVTDPKNR